MERTFYEVIDYQGFVIATFYDIGDAAIFVEAKFRSFIDLVPVESRCFSIREHMERPVEK